MRKRLSFILLLVLSTTLAQLSINCSKPLEFTDGDPNEVDTIFLTDSIFISDSSVVFDTVYLTDSIYIVDTFYITDSSDFCARLSATRQEIVWLLNNESGDFSLKFLGQLQSEKPPQELIITIGDQEFLWSPVQTLEFSFDLKLDEKAIITIVSDKPHAYGHAIDICLYVEKK